MTPRFFHTAFPRVGLCRPLPTPLQAFPTLADSLGLAALFIKRDDLTHPDVGGNKVRKLEYLVGDALDRGARTLVTAGGAGSNHALATAWFGRTMGLDTAAMLLCQPDNPDIEPYLKAHRALGTWVLGGPIRPVSRPRRPRGPDLVARLARPYWIPAGGSSPLGLMGLVSAACELADQLPPGGVDAIVVAAGSLGTAVGLAVGAGLAGLRVRVYAVSAVPWPLSSDRRMRSMVGGLVRLCRERFGVAIRPAPLSLVTGSVGRGYGYATAEGAAAIQLFADHGAPRLDTVYTGKAAGGMVRMARRELAARRVVFWHTKGWWADIAQRAARLTA